MSEPAFPVLTYSDGSGVQTGSDSGWEIGLTKLEYFAGQALVAFMSNQPWVKGLDAELALGSETNFKDALAIHSFRMAEAMLAESERRQVSNQTKGE